MTIGFIGLGVMGEPMCRNLLARTDEELVVFDLRREPMERLAEAGASTAASVAEVVRRADPILLSMPGGPELEAVVAGAGGVLETLAELRDGGGRSEPSAGADGVDGADGVGRLVIDHTTAPLALTRDLAARCTELGARYCDAPIARTRQAAADGTLSIMVGGTAEAFAAAVPVLDLMATDVTHCGGVGSGQITKLLNNMMLFQNVRAIAEAHAIAVGLDRRIGEDLGLDVDTVFEVIAGASGGSFALANHGRKSVLADDYPNEAFSTVYAAKDLSYALELAGQAEVDAVGAVTVGELLARTADAGYRNEYFPVMRKLLSPDRDASPPPD
ncbi:MAG: NAD(P)-dependent oxidoreductase [Actinomycetota bacterium]